MIDLIKNKCGWQIIIACLLLIVGGLLIWQGLFQRTKIVVDGFPFKFRNSALTVQGMLQSAGISLDQDDKVYPDVEGFIWDLPGINITSAKNLRLWTPNKELAISTTATIPGNILLENGISLFPQDRVLLDGEWIDPGEPLINESDLLIQFQPAQPVDLEISGIEHRIYTDQATLGAALEAASVEVGPQDWVSESLLAPIRENMTVSIQHAQPLSIKIGDSIISGLSPAHTVGEALSDAGLPLQNLDVSIPAADEPVPQDGVIELVRVWEDLLLETDEVAFENEYASDPETTLDEYSVIEPGQPGIYASRDRIQYANGQEVHRWPEGTWQASEPRNGVLGYGTKVVIRIEVVDGVTIEYWRKKTVFATSYEPCDNQGVCHDGTAGGYPLQRGIVAVTPQWYSVPNGLAMADLNVYVPGYGRAIIGDVGGGIPGTPWIDVAYRPEDDFTWDAHWTTMYFLTPVPDIIPPIITP